MGIVLPQEVDVGLLGTSLQHYTDLGYEIPRRIDSQGRLKILRGTKIKISVLDLPKGSNVAVKVICNICGSIHNIVYNKYTTKFEDDFYICSDTQKHKQLLLEQDYISFKNQILNFAGINNRFPNCNELKETNNIFNYSKCLEIAHMKNTTVNGLLADIDCFKSKSEPKYYNAYVEKFKNVINETQHYLSYDELHKNEFGLPDARWFIEHCPDKTINDYPSFVRWCGFKPFYDSSKEEAIQCIYKMQSELNRPLMYDDFRGSGIDKICISTVNQYWGTMNKMKVELGLEIVQENMIDKQTTIEEVENAVKMVCNDIFNIDGRRLLTVSDFNKRKDIPSYGSIFKYLKQYKNMTPSEYLHTIGFELVKAGDGLKFEYTDGEKVLSQFEYLFSNYLRDYGLTCNIDYFRDVKYKDFISNYKGNMNCDYIINYNGKKIYIEIAGILREYKTWYYANKEITNSQHKESYRLKLKQKEQMFKDNNLIYFILFPCDLTRDILLSILQDSSLKCKKDIELFYKNNIDFTSVLKSGELKYIDRVNNNYKNGSVITIPDYSVQKEGEIA